MDNNLRYDIQPWFCERLAIRDSNISGLGLFTLKDIRQGDEVLRLGGTLFHLSERRISSIMPSTAVSVSEEIIIAETVEGERDFSDYINHSCEPNLGFRDALTIVAAHDIASGEELVIDYMYWEADCRWELKHPCNCGSPLCRTLVSGNDWQQVKPSDSRFQFLSPFLKRRILKFDIGITHHD